MSEIWLLWLAVSAVTPRAASSAGTFAASSAWFVK